MKNLAIRTASVLFLTVMMGVGLNAQYGQYGNRKHIRNGQEFVRGGCEFARGQKFGNGHARMNQALALDLTEEQTEAMKALRLEHYKTMKPLRNKMVELKARERTLLSEEVVDLKLVNKGIDEQTDLMNKMKKLQAEQKVNAKEILTDEQIMKLEGRRQFSKQRNI